jgi:hypothetical protein
MRHKNTYNNGYNNKTLKSSTRHSNKMLMTPTTMGMTKNMGFSIAELCRNVMLDTTCDTNTVFTTLTTKKLLLSRYRPEKALGGSSRLKLQIFMKAL